MDTSEIQLYKTELKLQVSRVFKTFKTFKISISSIQVTMHAISSTSFASKRIHFIIVHPMRVNRTFKSQTAANQTEQHKFISEHQISAQSSKLFRTV